jgi:diadenosine tetraphosphate (Ap4A) HIT family hydrolase
MGEAELKAFRAKFCIAELHVLDTVHWTWSVRPAQPTLGATVLSLRRPAASFGEVAAVERATRSAFSHDKINYLMLMMVDPHVHFHVLPRYASPRRFADLDWTDAGWPGVPSLVAEPSTPEVLAAIRRSLA